MDLHELESFVMVAEELHFGRAAARAHVSQPALSQRIRRLEEELGFTLFTRDRRRVELTPAGAVLFQRARRLLADADAMVAAAARVAEGRGGMVRVGYVTSALYGPIPIVMRWLREHEPDIDLALEECKTGRQLELLEQGRIDAGFVHLPDHGAPNFRTRELGREPQVLALPAGHALAATETVAFAELAGEPIVLFPRELDPDTYDRIVHACATHGFTPNVVQEAPNLQALIGLVASGLGVAFVAASTAAALQPAGVEFRPLAPAILELTNAFVWRDDADSRALDALVKAVEGLDA
jgi:DNA-binding transcriptional LysR family regulator